MICGPHAISSHRRLVSGHDPALLLDWEIPAVQFQRRRGSVDGARSHLWQEKNGDSRFTTQYYPFVSYHVCKLTGALQAVSSCQTYHRSLKTASAGENSSTASTPTCETLHPLTPNITHTTRLPAAHAHPLPPPHPLRASPLPAPRPPRNLLSRAKSISPT